MEQSPPISFDFIYTSYYKKAFRFAQSYVHDEMVAEDLASEALIALWEKTKIETVEQIAPLLLIILKNKALDYLKHEQVRNMAFESMADWQQQELALRLSALEACDPEDIFSEEVKTLVNRTLKSLPAQTRQIFVLSRFENKSNREIAEMLSISIKAVEYHITKTLKVLRVALKDYLPLFYFLYYYTVC